MSLAKIISKYWSALALFVVFLLVWQLAVTWSNAKPTILPSPLRVVAALLDFWDVIFDHLLYTLLEAGVGFGLALAGGLGFAAWLDSSPNARKAVYPFLVASQTIPLVVIAPLLIIWFGYDLLPKLIVVFLNCFFPIVVASLDGFDATEPEVTRLFQSLGASRWQIFWKLRLPSALPFVFSGVRVAITYSLGGAVISEYVGAQKGLGVFIQFSKNSYRNDLIFAAVLVIALVSVGLFGLVQVVQRGVMPYYFRLHQVNFKE